MPDDTSNGCCPFQPTLPARGATFPSLLAFSNIAHFNPRSPHGERLYIWQCGLYVGGISTHAPRTGSDRFCLANNFPHGTFQPTLPARGATFPSLLAFSNIAHFNPRSPHGERPFGFFKHCANRYFNPRSPHGERRNDDVICRQHLKFQPTLPARGATCASGIALSVQHHFNPRSPHGERRRLPRCNPTDKNFNPRSPHGERHVLRSTARRSPHFNPRSPHGERRRCRYHSFRHTRISTHAPRTGSDPSEMFAIAFSRYFNPRSPHGERPTSRKSTSPTQSFQPTLPARGATILMLWLAARLSRFQPTLPARGATIATERLKDFLRNFNPRSPHGERRPGFRGAEGVRISTHAPRTGSDRSCRADRRGWKDFNPRSPHGERPPQHTNSRRFCRISTHAPRTGSDAMPSRNFSASGVFQPTLPARGATGSQC